MVKHWIKHENGRVIRGEGLPPSQGDVFFVGEDPSESAAIVNGALVLQGQVAIMGTYTFVMKSGDTLVVECDNSGRVVTLNGEGYGNNGPSA